eukprot:jgi/Chlat1/7697/Chrsp64S07181
MATVGATALLAVSSVRLGVSASPCGERQGRAEQLDKHRFVPILRRSGSSYFGESLRRAAVRSSGRPRSTFTRRQLAPRATVTGVNPSDIEPTEQSLSQQDRSLFNLLRATAIASVAVFCEPAVVAAVAVGAVASLIVKEKKEEASAAFDDAPVVHYKSRHNKQDMVRNAFKVSQGVAFGAAAAAVAAPAVMLRPVVAAVAAAVGAVAMTDVPNIFRSTAQAVRERAKLPNIAVRATPAAPSYAPELAVIPEEAEAPGSVAPVVAVMPLPAEVEQLSISPETTSVFALAVSAVYRAAELTVDAAVSAGQGLAKFVTEGEVTATHTAPVAAAAVITPPISAVAVAATAGLLPIPLATSAEVPLNKPVRMELLGEPLVLFRPRPGAIAVLPDLCPHRGASLSMGPMVKSDSGDMCVRCPYHGLDFNEKGKCQQTRHIKTDSLQAFDAHGIVWVLPSAKHKTECAKPGVCSDAVAIAPVKKRTTKPAVATKFNPWAAFPFLDATLLAGGSSSSSRATKDSEELAVRAEAKINEFRVDNLTPEQLAALCPFDEDFLTPGFRAVAGVTEIDAEPSAVVENTYDVFHINTVHTSTFASGELIRNWWPDKNTTCFEYGMRKENPFRRFYNGGRLIVTVKRMPPYSAMVTVADANGTSQFKTLTHVVPAGPHKSRLVWVLLRNFLTTPLVDVAFRMVMRKVVSEDKVVLERLNSRGRKWGMDLLGELPDTALTQ